MIVKELRVAGFRGIRDEVKLCFARGFTVLTGRNGSGKSTICDAIEYALAGTIRTASSHKEKGESISDYLWWKGESPPNDPSVTLTLLKPDGSEVTLQRTPTDFRIDGADTVEDVVCALRDTDDEAISRLCQTSIIRDEEITQLSVDLPEAERFKFVHLALGTHDFAPVETKLKATQKRLDEESVRQQKRYDANRQKVSDLTTRISAARAEAAHANNVRSANESVRSILKMESASNLELIAETQRKVALNQSQLDALSRTVRRLEELEVERASLATPAFLEEVEAAKELTQALATNVDEHRSLLEAAEAKLDLQRQELPKLTALAELYAIGQQVGLQEGKCPLCGSTVSDLAEHIKESLSAVNAKSQTLQALTEQAARMRQSLVSLRGQLDSARVKQAELERRITGLEGESEAVTDALYSLGYPTAEPVTIKGAQDLIEKLRTQTVALDAALSTLESSRAQARVTELERELDDARAEAQEIKKALDAVTDASRKARDASAALKRTQGEFVEERLAELSPLISELYLRLRPHVDWRTIHYKLRGDVRRMLSFQVGGGLNPSFVFSSGQRRAAGLAFLLAVHLSRRWCQLDTLIMDDPVQHIDDFRALNLVEVLGAIRKSGRQVVCAVEDEALGALLCRRLRTGPDSEGLLVHMTYDSNRGAYVDHKQTIRASGSRALGAA